MSSNLLLLSLGVYLAGGVLALLASGAPRAALLVGAWSCVVGGILGAVSAILSLFGGPLTEVAMPVSVLGERFSFGVDPLSAAFLLPISVLSGLFAVYGVEYLRRDAGHKALGAQAFFYNVLAASMAAVVTARNGAFFLVAWEVMSLSSFFLVAYDHEKEEVRDASRIYLIATHLGALALIAFFALLSGNTGSMDFDPVAARGVTESAATLMFCLALAGFGAKAGFWPLHVWLPKAHPAAPSHVSALMSGVMIKTGIYGICRVLWLFGPTRPSWGGALLVAGVLSAVVGALFALGQRDVKALLAYCSVENVGIIAVGLGVGVIGSAHGLTTVSALGYGGALFHVWNHSLYKGLLFLSTGAVLHGTGTRDVERLGGLLKRMPATGWCFLVGSASISALPPLNGIASEWLVFSGLLYAGMGADGWQGLLPLVCLAAMALAGALALAAFAKAFGIAFLGAPRSAAVNRAHDPKIAMLAPMSILAAGCLAVGLAPALVFKLLAAPVGTLDGGAANAARAMSGVSSPLARVGYVGAGLFAGVLAVLVFRKRLLRDRQVGASPTWDCGYGAPSARMQYTGASLSMPVTSMFGSLMKVTPRLKITGGYFPSGGVLETTVADTADRVVWSPLADAMDRGLGRFRFLQGGRLQLYLLAIFVTLLALLAWALIPV